MKVSESEMIYRIGDNGPYSLEIAGATIENVTDMLVSAGVLVPVAPGQQLYQECDNAHEHITRRCACKLMRVVHAQESEEE